MAASPSLSVVVVAYDMARELPRTLRTLVGQEGVPPAELEVVVVDNGSDPPVEIAQDHDVTVRLVRVEAPSPSPAPAANLGVREARGELIGLIVDGARMASPGLFAGALRASRVTDRAVVTAPAFHLGDEVQVGPTTAAVRAGEDELLARSGWEQDGYALFDIAVPARSSGRGLFGPMGESSSLFMPRSLWDELGGLDERFVLPGGGLVNHDLYRRACGIGDLVVVLGEGTFHQAHGGASTSGRVDPGSIRAEYEAITGATHAPPRNAAVFVGSVHPRYRRFLEWSLALAHSRDGADATALP